MTNDITIRKMTSGDLPAVMKILKQWNMAPCAPNEEFPDPERSGVEVENTFVALDDDHIVGTCSYIVCNPELAETASLAVDPLYKGRGIGYRLQMARLDEMRSRGFSRVRTETDRPETIAWYKKKFGYVEVGTNPKKHPFSLRDVDFWTVLELDLKV